MPFVDLNSILEDLMISCRMVSTILTYLFMKLEKFDIAKEVESPAEGLHTLLIWQQYI